jgi:hypothetical protein
MGYEKIKDLEEKILSRLLGFRLGDVQVSNTTRINCILGSKVNWTHHEGLVFIHAKKRSEIFYKDGRKKGDDEIFKLHVQGVQSGHSISSHVSRLKPVDDQEYENHFKLYDLARVSPDGKFTGEFNRPSKDLTVFFEGDLRSFTIETRTSTNDILDRIIKSREEASRNYLSKKNHLPKDQLSFDDIDPIFFLASSQIRQSNDATKPISTIKRVFDICYFYVKVVIPADPSLPAYFDIIPDIKGYTFPKSHLVSSTKSTNADLLRCGDMFFKSVAEYEALSEDEKINPNECQMKIIRRYQFWGSAYHTLLVSSNAQALPVSEWIDKYDQMMAWVDEIKQGPFTDPNLKMGF